ncbi:hypothetical protein Hanom_Chr14g01298091 [Helianthus anomalus]
MDINSSPMTHWNQKRTYQGTNSNRLTKLILRYNYTIRVSIALLFMLLHSSDFMVF